MCFYVTACREKGASWRKTMLSFYSQSHVRSRYCMRGTFQCDLLFFTTSVKSSFQPDLWPTIMKQLTDLLAINTGGTLNEKCCFSKVHLCGSIIECDCYTLNLWVCWSVKARVHNKECSWWKEPSTQLALYTEVWNVDWLFTISTRSGKTNIRKFYNITPPQQKLWAHGT